MNHADQSEAVKSIGDAVSIATVAGTLMDILPAIAALFTIVWTIIRIYETKTVQTLLKRNVDDTA